MTNKQEPKWRVTDPQSAYANTLIQLASQMDPARCAVSGDDLTPADCGPGVGGAGYDHSGNGNHMIWKDAGGPGVGGAASEPLYEECLAMQGSPEIVVTDEMVAAAENLDHCYRPEGRPDLMKIYRAMAAVAPKSTADNWWSMQWQRGQDRIAALEAENAKLREGPIELYREDERKIDALEAEVARLSASRDVAIDGLQRAVAAAMALLEDRANRLTAPEVHALLAGRDDRIATLESELAAMRVTTQPTSAQTGVGDKDKPSAAPKPMPASALAPKQSDPRRIGG